MRILIGCEFGGGRGHITFVKAVRDAISNQHPDAQLQFHLYDDHWARQAGLTNVHVLPDFRPLGSAKQSASRQTFGQMVFEALVAGPESWPARLQYWQAAIAAFEPDVILAEYAPGLSTFARRRMPCVVSGTGYSVPPPELPQFPIFREDVAGIAQSEDECLAILNRGLVAAGARRLDALPQLNSADFVAMVTIPLFDPYWQIRRQEYLGTEMPAGAPHVATPRNSGCAYFSQLLGGVEGLKGLGRVKLPIEALIADRPEHWRQVFHNTNVTLRDTPFDLQTDLSGAALAVHSGGLGFAAAAVHAGTPQVILFMHDEHWSHARALHMAQIGLGLPLKSSGPDQIAEAIHRVTSEPHFRTYATALAERYKPFTTLRPSHRVARELIRLAG